MLIPTNEVPQADDLARVVRVAEAVKGGARTDQDIAQAIGGYDPRQGRYYRRAAELLGFIRNEPTHNRSTLTRTGLQLVRSASDVRDELLVRAVVATRLVQRLIPFFESHRAAGTSRGELEDFLNTVTATTPAMVSRRLSTIISWLTRVDLIEERDGRYVLKNLPGAIEMVEYAALDEPLLPQTHALSEYQGVARKVKQETHTLSVLINEAARERASQAHDMLTKLVASKIRAAGAIPRQNRLIDLATRVFNEDYLFEMKSTTARNFHSQVRSAISQLYEYRYLYSMTNAKLVVVVENPPPRERRWLVDYVTKDRQLLIAWDGDRRTLQCPEPLRDQLRFLD